ncbi:MAG: hypothetical protein Greene101449_1033 [Candidatus Peregrinibacteria bacterium Greene1014_49]|nr:MAG: hypothetical protein Greene101449_1033 [Candidatus Peregrinibacteria bacterium Greene1014_49]
MSRIAIEQDRSEIVEAIMDVLKMARDNAENADAVRNDAISSVEAVYRGDAKDKFQLTQIIINDMFESRRALRSALDDAGSVHWQDDDPEIQLRQENGAIAHRNRNSSAHRKGSHGGHQSSVSAYHIPSN